MNGDGKTIVASHLPYASLIDGVWRSDGSPAAIEKQVREGHDPMPKFQGKLTDEEIRQVVAYVGVLSRSAAPGAAGGRGFRAMSRRIPLFPLPDVVLLPGTLLPLHIFEPRYRAMVADALEGDRTIGMTMLKAGAEAREDAPAIHRIGTAGEIVESEALPDGRYNILLEARFRFRVLDEAAPDPYRIARVEEVRTVPHSAKRRRASGSSSPRPASSAWSPARSTCPRCRPRRSRPERLASEMALRLRYAPPELQGLLETDSLASRFEALQGRMREWKERLDFLAPFRPAELDVRNN